MGNHLELSPTVWLFLQHKCLQTFCEEHDNLHVKAAAGTPREIGQIERLNKTILTCLSTGQDYESSKPIGIKV